MGTFEDGGAEFCLRSADSAAGHASPRKFRSQTGGGVTTLLLPTSNKQPRVYPPTAACDRETASVAATCVVCVKGWDHFVSGGKGM